MFCHPRWSKFSFVRDRGRPRITVHLHRAFVELPHKHAAVGRSFAAERSGRPVIHVELWREVVVAAAPLPAPPLWVWEEKGLG